MNTNALTVRGQRSNINGASRSGAASPRWLIFYYVVQIACQLALLVTWLSGARLFFRSTSYVISLILLAVTAGRTTAGRQPAARLALVTLAILGLEIFHPQTESAIGALATIAMYAAILGPLFWAPRLALDVKWFRRLVFMIWGFQSLSALFGALQVYFPDTFHSSVSAALEESYVSSLQITLSNGERILRPSGLTDIPGGAAVGGTYAILLALGLWTDEPKRWLRVCLAASIAIGMFVVYICQIRSLVVMIAISIVATGLTNGLSGRVRRFASTSVLLGAIASVAFVAAVAVGGEDVTRRLSTLIASSPTEVYYTNRGIFLEHTLFDLLPQYPLGAGLARWGMVANYFGVTDPATFIYVEIQWTGWLLDGGVVLIFVYCLMLGVTIGAVWRLAQSSSDTKGGAAIATWAAALIGYDLGTVALTFNFPAFMSGFGMDFWLLNAALLTVAAREKIDSAPS